MRAQPAREYIALAVREVVAQIVLDCTKCQRQILQRSQQWRRTSFEIEAVGDTLASTQIGDAERKRGEAQRPIDHGTKPRDLTAIERAGAGPVVGIEEGHAPKVAALRSVG